jgi:hypothetical protein
VYSAYEEALQDLQRYADSRAASAGFESLKYKTAAVIFDHNTNFGTTAEKAYFLNTDYLFLRKAKGRWMVPLGEKSSVNQDAIVKLIGWAGNLTSSGPQFSGCLIA